MPEAAGTPDMLGGGSGVYLEASSEDMERFVVSTWPGPSPLAPVRGELWARAMSRIAAKKPGRCMHPVSEGSHKDQI